MAHFGSKKDADVWFKHSKQLDRKKTKSKEQKEIARLKKKVASLEKQVEYWKEQYHRERSCHEHNPPNW
jgi:hypothetical protein